MTIKSITFIILFSGLTFSIKAQDATEIIRKMDDKLQGKSNKSEMKMTIVRPKYTRTIAFKNWSLGRDYFLTYVTAPSKDKGMVSMKYQKEMWSYTPSINRMIKLPPSMMSQGWMGSDYTNDDLVKQSSIVNDLSLIHI
jgi:outer membrane lipoprotein-sorting protein